MNNRYSHVRPLTIDPVAIFAPSQEPVLKISHRVMLGCAAVAAAAIIVPLSIVGAAPTTAAATTVHTGQFHSVGPTRILDTRTGLGAPKALVGPGGKVVVQATGGAVPTTGISAVVLNVTETNATQASFLTVWPDGETRPAASNLNFTANLTEANSVTVKVSAAGKVDIYNSQGSVNLIADITGYFLADDTAGTGGDFTPVPPERLIDTRDPALGALSSHQVGYAGYTFSDPTTDSHILALAVNITAVNPKAAGYFTTWNGVGSPPNTSVLNFPLGRNVPNFAIVPAARCQDLFNNCDPTQVNAPMIAVENFAPANVDLIVDIAGFFDDGTLVSTVGAGARFTPLSPTRIVDSRSAKGIAGPLGAGKTATINAAAIGDQNTVAFAANLTAVAPTASTYLTFWPDGPTPPLGSTLNPVAGQTVANAAILGLSATHTFNVFNAAGTTGLIVDVNGFYDLPPAPPTTAAPHIASPAGELTGQALTPRVLPGK